MSSGAGSEHSPISEAKERKTMGWARLDERSNPRKKRVETYRIKFGQNKPRLALMTPPTITATALHRWNGKNNAPMPMVGEALTARDQRAVNGTRRPYERQRGVWVERRADQRGL